MAENRPGRFPQLPGASRQVVRLGVTRADVVRFQIVDTDIVATLKSGHKMVVPDGAVKTMLDPDFVISFNDGDVLGTQIMQSAGPLEVSQVTTTTVGAPPETHTLPEAGKTAEGASVFSDTTSTPTPIAATAASARHGGIISSIKSLAPLISAVASVGGLAVASGSGKSSNESTAGSSSGNMIGSASVNAGVAPSLYIDAIGSSMVINTTSPRTVTGITTDNTGPITLQIGSNREFATIASGSFTSDDAPHPVYTWTYTFTDAQLTTLTQGTNNIRASQTTAVGVSAITSVTQFTVDTSAPAAPTVALTHDTGISNSDRILSDPALTPLFETGATVSYSTDQTNWSSTQPTWTSDGDKTVYVRQTDPAGNISPSANVTFTLDTTAPTINGASGVELSTSGNSPLTTDDVVTATVTFNEAVAVDLTKGSPTLILHLDSGDVSAGYAGAGNNDHQLKFTYRIKPGDGDTNGITIDAGTLGGTLSSVTDVAGNTANTYHGEVASTYTVDTSPPSILADGVFLSNKSGNIGNWLNAGDTVTATVLFTKAVTWDNTNEDPVLQLSIGGSTREAQYFGGRGSDTLTFTYTIGSNLDDSSGISINGPLLSNGTTIQSLAGAQATLAFMNVDPNKYYLVDTTAPTLSITNDQDGTANIAGGGILYTFTFSESVTGFTADSVSVDHGAKGKFTAVSGSEYTLVVTPASGFAGNLTVDVDAGAAIDVAGNPNAAEKRIVQPVDMSAPTITGVTAGWGSFLNATEANSTGTVTVATSGVENGQTVTLNLNGRNYTGTLSGNSSTIPIDATDLKALTDGGSYTLTANVSDAAGNAATANTATSFTVDKTPPNPPSMNPGTGVSDGATAAEATSSEGVVTATSEQAGSIAVTFADHLGHTVIKTVSGTGAARPVVLAAEDLGSADNQLTDGTITVSAVSTDAAGNSSSAGTTSFTLDTTRPSVAITDNKSGTLNLAGGDITCTFTFSEAVTGFDASKITLANGTKGAFTSVDGSHYTLVVTPSSGFEGNLTVDVASGSASDAAGNTNTAAIQDVQAVDTSRPSVAITDNKSGTLNLAGGDITYTFTFSEAVTGFDASKITLANGTKGAFTSVDGSHYTLVVTPGSGFEGNLTVDVASGSASDAAGNTNTAAVQDVQAVDTKAPAILSVAIASAIKTLGSSSSTLISSDTVTAKVQFNDTVTVTGTPTLGLNIGGTNGVGGSIVTASYASGSGTDTLYFTYTIPSDHSPTTDTSGIGINANSLSLNGGTISDTPGNTATLTHTLANDNISYKVDTRSLILRCFVTQGQQVFLTQPNSALSYNFTVDWGDGTTPSTITAYNDADFNHVYAVSGNYFVTLSGTMPSFNLTSAAPQAIIQWGDTGLSSLANAMAGVTAIGNQTISDFPSLAAVTSLYMLFSGSTLLQDISGWNTGSINNMAYTFYAAKFNQNIGNWNTGSVTSMTYMFTNSQFNQNIGNWNTGSVLNMNNTFSGSPFNQNISRWNTSKVTDMSSMFENAPQFNQNIGTWNTGSVLNMSSMFYGTPFNQDIGGWDTSKIKNFGYMFANAGAFNQNIGEWNVASLTSAGGMLVSASSFSTDNFDKLLAGWADINPSSGETSLQNNVAFNAFLRYYTDATALQYLTSTFNWSIDNGTGNNSPTFTSSGTFKGASAYASKGTNNADTMTPSSVGSNTATPQIMHGLGGNDSITGGTRDDLIVGGAGDDTLSGGSGSDTFRYYFTNEGNDTITDFIVGSGGDTLDISYLLNSGVKMGYTPANTGVTAATIGSFVTLSDAGLDKLRLTIDADGPGPNSTMVTVTLNDVSYSAAHATGDSTYLQNMITSGNLLVTNYWLGTSGSDTMTGDAVNDTFRGMGGNDTIDGGAGVDTVIYSGSRSDFAISYDSGTTRFTITDMLGGQGSDTVGNVESFLFNGVASTAAELIAGTNGYYLGTSGNNSLTGTSANDIFRGLEGNDTIDGGGGANTVTYNGSRAMFGVYLNTGVYTIVDYSPGGGEGTDTVSNVQNFIFNGVSYTTSTVLTNTLVSGTSGNDTLSGTSANEIFKGLGGNDTITGGGGADTIIYTGFRANYTVFYTSGVFTVVDTMVSDGNDGIDTVGNVQNFIFNGSVMTAASLQGSAYTSGRGTSGNDTLTGDSANNCFLGLAGDDTINGVSGTDTVIYSGDRFNFGVSVNAGTYTIVDNIGTEGTDTVSNVQNFIFNGVTYTASTLAANTFTTGTVGNDPLNGTSANDTFRGLGGNDTIDGGAGDDTVIYNGNRSNFTVNYEAGTKVYTVNDTTGVEGTDTVSNVEHFIFNGVTYNAVGSSFAITVDTTSPLVLDLNGDGVHTTTLEEGVRFDAVGYGLARPMAWVDRHDGLLALDLNHNGTIDNGTELFGSATLLPGGGTATDGYLALAQYDTNGDGLIDSHDNLFTDLQVWLDSNSDGHTDAGELHSLTDLGIASLDLHAQSSTRMDNGNSLALVSGWTDTAGQYHDMADVYFVTGADAATTSHPATTLGSDQLPALTTSAGGIDTLTFNTDHQSLDLTRLGSTTIDRFDLGTFGGNSAKISLTDVLDMGNINQFNSASGWEFSNSTDAANAATYHQMVFDGGNSSANGESIVTLADASAAGGTPWALSGTATHNGLLYDVYTSTGAVDHAHLLIEHSLKVSMAVL